MDTVRKSMRAASSLPAAHAFGRYEQEVERGALWIEILARVLFGRRGTLPWL